MSARYPVKWYTQDMQGAPQMNGSAVKAEQQPGKLAALMKQVLVTGFGLLAVDSLSYDSINGEVTATISGGHQYLKDSVLLIEGANEAAFNGEQRVTFVNATQFRYVPATPPSVSAATGTLSAKVAPAGWEVVAEDASGEKVIFGATDPDANFVKILVSNTLSDFSHTPYSRYTANVSMVENVTDINTFETLKSGVWPASHYGGEMNWQLVADPRIFFFLQNYTNKKKAAVVAFGDINSVRPNDKYSTIIVTISIGYWSLDSHSIHNDFLAHSSVKNRHLARPYHQLLEAVSWKTLGLFPHMGMGIPLPNPADNGFYVGVDNIPISEDDDTLRGYLPGVVNPYNDSLGLVNRNHHGIPSFPGKIIRFVRATKEDTSSPKEGLIGFDLTGPWR